MTKTKTPPPPPPPHSTTNNNNDSSNNKNNDDESTSSSTSLIEPFEWLTNFSSVAHLLDPKYLFHHHQEGQEETQTQHSRSTSFNRNLSVLHVGCGSSIFAEQLIRQYKSYTYLVNIDTDEEILLGMKKRWHTLLKRWGGRVHAVPVSGQDKNEIISTCLWTKFDFNQINLHEKDHEANDDDVVNDGPNCNHHNDENQLDTCTLQTHYFDLVLDKSTLDCALCSNDATSGLLCNVYESLKPSGGVYFVISFHHVDFIMPLLKDCPGLNWDVQHHVVSREVESPAFTESLNSTYHINLDYKVFSKRADNNISEEQKDSYAHSQKVPQPSSWSQTDGTFQPDEQYGKYVNVFICTKRLSSSSCLGDDVNLDRNQVRMHIHDCNDRHFKEHNPMVTHVRKERIKHLFLEEIQKVETTEEQSGGVQTIYLPTSNSEHCNDNFLLESNILSLQTCYNILFTEAEKEHLPFEYFMEDFIAFQENHDSLIDMKGMNFDNAILFLEVMQ